MEQDVDRQLGLSPAARAHLLATMGKSGSHSATGMTAIMLRPLGVFVKKQVCA
jgi:hypothetical protein